MSPHISLEIFMKNVLTKYGFIFDLINKTGFFLFYVGTDSFKMYLEHYLNINKVIVKANTLL